MDSLSVISLVSLIVAFILGYSLRYRFGWLLLLIFPILGPGRMLIVPSASIPLDIYQFTLVAVFGMLLRQNSKYIYFIKKAFFDIQSKLMLLLLILVVIVSIGDRYIYFAIFGQTPQYLISILLPFILIQNENDIKKLVTIFSWQGFIIGGFIFISYIYDFHITELFRSTIPGYEITQVDMGAREGRVHGLDGDAILTSARLSFLLPLAIWYYLNKKRFIYVLPFMFITIGLIILQTRAAIVAIVICGIIIAVNLSYTNKIFKKRLLNRSVIIIIMIILIIFILSPIIITFFSYTLSSFDPQSPAIDHKIERIPIALQYYFKNPLWGYGSPYVVYYDIMNTEDIPAVFIYFLSGGIILGIIYLLMLINLPYKTYKSLKYSNYNSIIDDLKVVAFGAFVAGIVFPFTNWKETHFMIMFILYFSFLKLQLLNQIKGKRFKRLNIK